jgi:hypothetical protein
MRCKWNRKPFLVGDHDTARENKINQFVFDLYRLDEEAVDYEERNKIQEEDL